MAKFEVLFADDVIDTIEAEDGEDALEIAKAELDFIHAHVEYKGRDIFDDTSDEEAQDYWQFVQENLKIRPKIKN